MNPSNYHFLEAATIVMQFSEIRFNLNKRKLGEPEVYLKPVEQTLYSAAAPINKNCNNSCNYCHAIQRHVLYDSIRIPSLSLFLSP